MKDYEAEGLRDILRDVHKYATHDRVAPFLNRFQEWRQIVGRIGQVLDLAPKRKAKKKAGKK